MAYSLRVAEWRVGRSGESCAHVATVPLVRRSGDAPHTHKLSVCPEHGAMDRDVNAAVNIAARAVPRVAKARATRAKNRKLMPQQPLKTPAARNSLKYPGRDRTKNKPTPRRKNHRRAVREVILPSCPARAQAYRLEARVLADGGAVRAAGTSGAALKQGYNNIQMYVIVALYDTLRSCCCVAQWLARARSLASGISRLPDERRKRWTCRRLLTSIMS